jgi:hypothetical protein
VVTFAVTLEQHYIGVLVLKSLFMSLHRLAAPVLGKLQMCCMELPLHDRPELLAHHPARHRRQQPPACHQPRPIATSFDHDQHHAHHPSPPPPTPTPPPPPNRHPARPRPASPRHHATTNPNPTDTPPDRTTSATPVTSDHGPDRHYLRTRPLSSTRAAFRPTGRSLAVTESVIEPVPSAGQTRERFESRMPRQHGPRDRLRRRDGCPPTTVQPDRSTAALRRL